MKLLQIKSVEGWTAEIIIADQSEDDFVYLEICSDGASKERALAGVQAVTDLLAKGRTCLFRVYPEADSDTDLATQITTHRGYARFAFRNGPDSWSDSRFKLVRREAAE